MNTRGLEVHCGYLVVPWGTGAAPVHFWNRLKHQIVKAGLVDAYKAEYASELVEVQRVRESGIAPSSMRLDEHEREARMFKRWTERVCGPQRLWPWQPGWTEDLVDSYLYDAHPQREVA